MQPDNVRKFMGLVDWSVDGSEGIRRRRASFERSKRAGTMWNPYNRLYGRPVVIPRRGKPHPLTLAVRGWRYIQHTYGLRSRLPVQTSKP